MIIADTSGLISLLIKTDSNHNRAKKIIPLLNAKANGIIIPEDIFSEFVNLLGRKFDHKEAYLASQKIASIKIFIIENTTEEVRNLALEKFRKQPESVSFSDCIVMAVADRFETKEIFGFDNAFRKNGYVLPS